ncbi:hypothetical protein ATANTOWER_008968 [Ataeniobius toweri]|uniref:G-protein coupled receptors family 2 profile 1 domain-containing protein n=1 Tax=Ataeniobius toweri TaxID=208326 RepID=A0ABU7BGK2_9TELE|nr:hypothetical protein [Ataeniobius toweri]
MFWLIWRTMYVRFSRCICLFLSCVLLEPVYSAQSSMCDLILEIDKERAMCHTQIDNTTGCNITWDKITCWPPADIGEEVTIPCPKYLFYLTSNAPPLTGFKKTFLFVSFHVAEVCWC